MSDLQNTSNVITNSFNKGMIKDLNETFVGEGLWSHARNAVNNSHDGQTGVLSNEPANKFSSRVPYTFIGAIYLTEDRWALFSSNNLDHEIGIYDESDDKYSLIVNDRSLNFSTSNLIIGVSKENHDCTRSLYWDDGRNPTRCLNIDRIPFIRKPKKVRAGQTCDVPEFTEKLDAEKIRLARLMKTPKLKLRKAHSGGSLPNGSYQVVVAYVVNGIRVTDYFTPSNVQSLFTHENMQGALELDIVCDPEFDEFELVLIANFNMQTSAKRMGIYNTRQNTVFIDRWNDSLITVPIDLIPLQTPAYDKSDALYEVNGHLIRVGVHTKPDFNYQPIANDIVAKWVAAEFPADYYRKGGNITSYMRDENYVFFIRWVYNTGEKSASYIVPGRPPFSHELQNSTSSDAIELRDENHEGTVAKYQVVNTASVSNIQQYALPDGKGRVIAEGEMGYHETTERYPDDKPEVWGDLCGKNVRLHKFPDNSLIHIHNQGGDKIIVLGVKFENIKHPVDEKGNPIQNVVGYEILRGSREGNRTIIAKGLLNNAAEYDIPENITDRKGLYPNYPYNDLRTDPFLSAGIVKGGCQGKGYKPMGKFRRDVFTFHSPDTQFKNPFLSPYELKIHTQQSGPVTGSFDTVFKHPKHKMIRDFALLIGGLVGVGTGLMAITGKKTTVKEGPKALNSGITMAGTSTGTSMANPAVAGYYGAGGFLKKLLTSITGDALSSAIDDITSTAETTATSSMATVPGAGMIGGGINVHQESSILSNLPLPLRIAGGTFLFTYFFAQGTEAAIRIIRSLIPYQQFAYQYTSHGFYNLYKNTVDGQRRRLVKEAQYLEPHLQEFSNKYRVNNLYRSRAVMLELNQNLADPDVQDNTRQTIGNLGIHDNPKTPFKTTTSALYGSLKVKMLNQYGQMDSVRQIPVSTETHETLPSSGAKYTSPVLFGGDVYINRYTEKNTFFYFNDWMFGEPNGYEMDYNLHVNIPYPRYWINTTEYDVSQLISALVKLNFKGNVLPNDLAALDRKRSDCSAKISFGINKGYFYLFNSGVRDFFVESEINLAQRDHGEQMHERHYDPFEFTDLKSLFRSDIVKSGNYFKYDFSLSISKLLHNFISWGTVLPRDYDPTVAATCFAYYPKRAIYSLPQNRELKKDNWTAFLANNYKDFNRPITSIKAVGKSGAMILFENDTPMEFPGVDQLQTDGGIKITIGDGGLFAGNLQSLGNADINYEYGSCQSRYAVLGTPAGLFWVSQNQGKIFHYTGNMAEISANGMMWWFAQYLPSQLLKAFPQFQLKDNPVTGVGVTSVYDNTNKIIYFSKRDYAVRDIYKDRLIYLGENYFGLKDRNAAKIVLGNPTYFEDASWTVSYDVKNQMWLSYHDWHPEFVLPSSKHFLTVKNGELWKHNIRTDRFCEFYGNVYPWEVELLAPTGQEVSTLRSVEYILECKEFFNNGRDFHHLLDENFDRAIVYNSEQISGLLKLKLKPKNDPYALIEYPMVSSNAMEILYSKEEQKYRFNQFWDITKNRAEFNDVYQPMWITEPNGYVKTINPKYVRYSKDDYQHKKFRHMVNRLLLRKTQSKNVQMLLKLVNTKQLKSSR